jgi:enoyl-CoA hydratase
VRNAVDRATAQALAEAFRAFDVDDSQSVAILTGAGGTFCAGADLQAIAQGRGNRIEEGGDGPMGPTRMTLSKPVIAAIEGHAVAGGLELALWCDLRVAAEDAVFGVFCRRWGVPLVDRARSGCWLIGHSHAMDLILTGAACPAGGARWGWPAVGAAGGRKRHSLAAWPASRRCMRSDRRAQPSGAWTGRGNARRSKTRLEVIRSGETQAGAAIRFRIGRHGRACKRYNPTMGHRLSKIYPHG